MTLPPNFNVYVSAAMFVLGAYFFALYLGLIVWTFRDIRSRTRDGLAQIMATLLVAVFTLPGLLVYLLLRPHTTLAEEYERSLTEEAILQDLEERRLCPECQHHVQPDFVVCPHCHHQLRLKCVGCGRLLNQNWDVCPYCGLFREGERTESLPLPERVHARPATRRGPQPQAEPEPATLRPAFVVEPLDVSGPLSMADGYDDDGESNDDDEDEELFPRADS
jgi:RNA polymerase subunit RPABC4/transcription elongation factor Spt4